MSTFKILGDLLPHPSVVCAIEPWSISKVCKNWGASSP